MMATLLLSVFVACGSDDSNDDGNIVRSINQALTGGWRGTPITGKGAIVCNFGSDGSLGVAVSNASGSYTEQRGTYTFTGQEANGVVNATWSDGTTEQLVAASITATSMYLEKGGVNYSMSRADVDESDDDEGDDDNQQSGGGSSVCSSCKGTGQCLASGLGCKGTGECKNCKGIGWYGPNLRIKCVICSGTGTCTYCKGTGVCKWCGGTGVR